MSHVARSRHDSATGDRVIELLERDGIAESDVLAVVESGSTAHGISVGGDDLDFTVVRIEPLAELVNGPPRRQSVMLRTKPEGVKSEPDDIDLQVYTLRRFASLAAAGNPSVLMILFAPPNYRLLDRGFPADRLADLSRSKKAGNAFRGYIARQLELWSGPRDIQRGSRMDVEKDQGFNTKQAAHTIRLGIQGSEYLRTGKFTMPMPEEDAARVRALRRGETSQPEALEWALRLLDELDRAVIRSPLPDEVDSAAVETFLMQFYGDRYGIR